MTKTPKSSKIWGLNIDLHSVFMALAKDIGLEISAEELQAASGLTDELTDDQLEGVSGGADGSSSK